MKSLPINGRKIEVQNLKPEMLRIAHDSRAREVLQEVEFVTPFGEKRLLRLKGSHGSFHLILMPTDTLWILEAEDRVQPASIIDQEDRDELDPTIAGEVRILAHEDGKGDYWT
jgi:hypothetical protein